MGYITRVRLAIVCAAALLFGGSQALAASWSIQTTPAAPGTTEALYDASCASSSACAAVGEYAPEGRVIREGEFEIPIFELALAEHWNGSSWELDEAPSPPRAHNSSLKRVSCNETSFCASVGEFREALAYISGRFIEERQLPLAEHWNGRTWSLVEIPLPSGARGGRLEGVSCVSTRFCLATGAYSESGGRTKILTEKWNGATWAVQENPGTTGALTGVSCSSSTACTAVGNTGAVLPLALRWNGTSWSTQAIPSSEVEFNFLLDVSCGTASTCVAVGTSYGTRTSNRMLVERWDGTRWALQTPPVPTGATVSLLFGVACIGESACTAVGMYTERGGAELTLAERWNGTEWSIQGTPNPETARQSILRGVSCSSTSLCTASGTAARSGALRALVERYS